MANYGFPRAPFPPYYQQQQPQRPPGTVNQEPYQNQNQPYASSPQNPPQYQQPFPGIPGMDMPTPVLDQNQMAYFWQQLASGNPALPSNVPLPQTSPVQPTPFSFPPYAPPPLPVSQQTQPAPTQSSPTIDVNLQHSRVNELGRSDREEGELSEEGEVSTPDSRGSGSWKHGKRANNNNILKTDSRGKANQGKHDDDTSTVGSSVQCRQGPAWPKAPRGHQDGCHALRISYHAGWLLKYESIPFVLQFILDNTELMSQLASSRHYLD
ncbi:hypothetical protein E6O75_ATG01555 [Venturia nashicola]|uniref:Uncharacterized protein n=1 Tax=Venturia nashicola TaxID=86259 RepID=A0A4Z1PCH1_9PEZI|nr:hypothetical protein E6O75_ATG01555 [Venturia nashicola]